ncbi:fungal-specific transcription factor domain-containing protein [Biscogniauxia mediterranea]|nr:fungal-specific transcription factor domain-containing protein [Biscogniauxia mediterranea]
MHDRHSSPRERGLNYTPECIYDLHAVLSFPADEVRQQERPYRSHLRPACLPCRRRKSRCKIEAHSPSCLMCQVHGTDCHFPNSREAGGTPPKSHGSPGRERPTSRRAARKQQTPTPCRSHGIVVESQTEGPPSGHSGGVGSTSIPPSLWEASREQQQQDSHPTPLSADDTEQESRHIVGPAVTSDSQVLAEYLSAVNSSSNSNSGMRLIRPRPTSGSKPVLFTAVRRGPLGLAAHLSPSQLKCQMIEKLLEPRAGDLINVYFDKVNSCLPLLNKDSFMSQYSEAKDRISPALLACLYAHSLVYGRFSPQLASHRCPDVRFVWNLANEAVYSEMHLSPGISTITAILLNVGGWPITSLMGNGVQLGSAVSLAHSHGLNHDHPSSWDIPLSEKILRMKIWWSLLIHDRCLAYGTPPHIQRGFYDVPLPRIENFSNHPMLPTESEPISFFIALSGLTDVLDHYLQYLYRLKRDTNSSVRNLEFRLNQWAESLEGGARWAITRGTQLYLPGAADLRLAYLSYIHVRRAAEDIVLLVRELQEQQLGDLWLPTSAFAFPSTVTFLLRCALETENSPAGLAVSMSLRLASALISALRQHQESSSWDLGDICLAQHAEIVEKLMMPSSSSSHAEENTPLDLGSQDAIIQDVSFVDELFPSLWDTFRYG